MNQLFNVNFNGNPQIIILHYNQNCPHTPCNHNSHFHCVIFTATATVSLSIWIIAITPLPWRIHYITELIPRQTLLRINRAQIQGFPLYTRLWQARLFAGHLHVWLFVCFHVIAHLFHIFYVVIVRNCRMLTQAASWSWSKARTNKQINSSVIS